MAKARTRYRLGQTVTTKGGAKGKEWFRFFTPGHGSLTLAETTPRSTKKAAAGTEKGPRGATDLVIPNAANPAARVIAGDVAVRAGGVPLSTPTVGAGFATAPAAAFVLGDTGALAAGTYLVEVTMGAAGSVAAGKDIRVEHRNAANASNVNVLGLCPSSQALYLRRERVVVALNERIRVVVGAILFAAAETTQAEIRVYLLAA